MPIRILKVTALLIFSFIAMTFTTPLQAQPEAKPTQADYDNIDIEHEVCAPQVPVCDCFEPVNRVMFTFNEFLDGYVMRPLACLYNKIIPRPLNTGIHNIFMNINTIPTIANDLLQLHFYQATNDIWRLVINTTIGIGGFFDVASCMGLEPYSNDFGLTLARYGWRCSTYIVLPVFGPNTIRDGIEIPVDYYKFSIYPYITPTSLRYQLLGLAMIDRRAQLLKFQCVMDEAAFDRYCFIRSAYLQKRCFQINNNDHRSWADQQCRRYQDIIRRPCANVVYVPRTKLFAEPGYLRIGN